MTWNCTKQNFLWEKGRCNVVFLFLPAKDQNQWHQYHHIYRVHHLLHTQGYLFLDESILLCSWDCQFASVSILPEINKKEMLCKRRWHLINNSLKCRKWFSCSLVTLIPSKPDTLVTQTTGAFSYRSHWYSWHRRVQASLFPKFFNELNVVKVTVLLK